MSEGHIYTCHWQLRDQKYEGYLDRLPQRPVVATSFEEMTSALGDLIIEAFGDGEPEFEFEPPYVATPNRRGLYRDGFRDLYVNEAFEVPSPADLFIGGLRPKCKQAIGARSAARLQMSGENVRRRSKAFAAAAGGKMRLPVFSAKTLELFTADERELFEARRVDFDSKPKMDWLEIIPHQLIAPVAGKALRPGGSQCVECGRARIAHAETLGWGIDVILRTAIPPGSSLFFVGNAASIALCFTADRWAEIKTPMRAAGVTSANLAVIEPDEQEHHPPLQQR